MLTLKQAAFCIAYLDKSSDTFGNATRAALLAYNTTDENVASSIGSENLRKLAIQNYIEEESKGIGIGIQDRLRVLAEIIAGQKSTRTTTNHYRRNKDTNKFEVTAKTEVEKGPNLRDCIAAIHAINKITGHYKDLDLAREQAREMLDDLQEELVPADVREEVQKELEEGVCTGTRTRSQG